MPYLSKGQRELLEYQFFAMSKKRISLEKDFGPDGYTESAGAGKSKKRKPQDSKSRK